MPMGLSASFRNTVVRIIPVLINRCRALKSWGFFGRSYRLKNSPSILFNNWITHHIVGNY